MQEKRRRITLNENSKATSYLYNFKDFLIFGPQQKQPESPGRKMNRIKQLK